MGFLTFNEVFCVFQSFLLVKTLFKQNDLKKKSRFFLNYCACLWMIYARSVLNIFSMGFGGWLLEDVEGKWIYVNMFLFNKMPFLKTVV